MMAIRIRVKSRPIPHGTNATDNALLLQKFQSAIHGIERDGGYPLAHSAEDRLGVRVFVGPGQLAKYLRSLMGCLDPLSPANLYEVRYALLCLLAAGHSHWLHSE
jgi:hypothetical protein